MFCHSSPAVSDFEKIPSKIMPTFHKYIFQTFFFHIVLVRKSIGKRQLGRAKIRFLNGSERKRIGKVFWITVHRERDKKHNMIMSPNLASTTHVEFLD